jgi:hypothetical protein
MPYFVFAVKPFAQLDKLGEFEVFKDASNYAKTLRAQQPAEEGVRIKVMFAEDQLSAEDLVNQLRTSVRTGDDE